MGGGNPPDKYQAVRLTGNLNNDLAAINALSDQGFRFVAFFSAGSGVQSYDAVLMGNYQGS